MIRNATEFGSAVRAARKRSGMNQTELATRCGVGINFLTDLEAGKPTCQLDKALTVAMELGFVFPDRPGPPVMEAETHEATDDPEDELDHLPSFTR